MVAVPERANNEGSGGRSEVDHAPDVAAHRSEQHRFGVQVRVTGADAEVQMRRILGGVTEARARDERALRNDLSLLNEHGAQERISAAQSAGMIDRNKQTPTHL